MNNYQQQPRDFYQDQTFAQPPYIPPPSPPSYMQCPQQPLLPHQRVWRRYRSMRKLSQWGIGCLTVFMLCGMCSCMAAIAAPSSQVTSSPTPTATSVVLGSTKQVTPTALPATPTPRPAPKPTPRPTAVPTAVPTQPPAPQPTPTQPPTGVNGNPWGYDFNTGNLIYNPPGTFCDYFNCIASFWNGTGYVIECQDQTFSKSGGHSGSCSRHGGDLRPLYSH